jgi:hypothetical protein
MAAKLKEAEKCSGVGGALKWAEKEFQVRIGPIYLQTVRGAWLQLVEGSPACPTLADSLWSQVSIRKAPLPWENERGAVVVA